MNIAYAFFLLLAPALVLWLCRKFPIVGKVDPVLILYVLGVVTANVFHPSGAARVQDLFSSATVVAAIPLMLFACTFRRSETRSQILALVTGLVAVLICVVAGFYIFGNHISDPRKIAGLLTGSYTGGTVNMAALKAMLGVSDETFVLVNSFDMAVCFCYLTFIISFGYRFFRSILPDNHVEQVDGEMIAKAEKETSEYSLLSRRGTREMAVLLVADALVIGLSAGLGKLAGEAAFMTVLVLMLTTLGIAASFVPAVKSCKHSYDIGMYLIYIFSITVASMADFSRMNFSGSLALVGYLAFVVFGSLALQVLFARILKIDADTMTISSVTFINSPPFVPMVAAAMKNRRALPVGLAIGVVGYAAGTYLGFIIYSLL